ncbi:hypothetical protein, partial [Salmonella sp. gx-f5]|uniref:hypothetical protein n=1 Tax=Salmonella sp. gx-f5 TaxID=2582605 RepID=UPI001F42FA7F
SKDPCRSAVCKDYFFSGFNNERELLQNLSLRICYFSTSSNFSLLKSFTSYCLVSYGRRSNIMVGNIQILKYDIHTGM